MRLKLKDSLTLDTDQLSCSESAKLFIDYAFLLNGAQVAPFFDSAMMRFVHALQDVVREGSIHVSGTTEGDFDITCVPEAISALAEAYPELSVRAAFAKWLSCCNTAHKKHLPSAESFSSRARVAACWWDERLIRPGVRVTVTADGVDARLKSMIENRALIDIAYANYLDALAEYIDRVQKLEGICAIHWAQGWFKDLTDWLDKKLGEFGEGSGGTWFLTEEIMKVTPTRVLVTEKDCEYCEILPGKFLDGDFDDDAIFRACDRHAYGRFISHEDFDSDR